MLDSSLDCTAPIRLPAIAAHFMLQRPEMRNCRLYALEHGLGHLVHLGALVVVHHGISDGQSSEVSSLSNQGTHAKIRRISRSHSSIVVMIPSLILARICLRSMGRLMMS